MASTPATCGVAMLVPDRLTPTSASLLMPRDRMESPGAKMFTHVPKLEPPEKMSEETSKLLIEPTVTMSAARAGELWQASPL